MLRILILFLILLQSNFIIKAQDHVICNGLDSAVAMLGQRFSPQNFKYRFPTRSDFQAPTNIEREVILLDTEDGAESLLKKFSARKVGYGLSVDSIVTAIYVKFDPSKDISIAIDSCLGPPTITASNILGGDELGKSWGRATCIIQKYFDGPYNFEVYQPRVLVVRIGLVNRLNQ